MSGASQLLQMEVAARRGEGYGRSIAPVVVLMDGHVHFHTCFSWHAFLEAAARNFQQAESELNLQAPTIGCLAFTESRFANSFDELRAGVQIDGWDIQRTDEVRSVICRSRTGQAIIILSGRQIVIREGLEVLAIGCHGRFADGQPIAGLIQQIGALGGLPVVPWGFGKWRLRRGRVVRRLVGGEVDDVFALGDNGGRARMLPQPGLFAKAEAGGIPVLPGSDPLPFPNEVHRVGSYGCLLHVTLDEREPAGSIVSALRQLRNAPRAFGRRMPLLRFGHMQLRMQVLKRMSGGAR